MRTGAEEKALQFEIVTGRKNDGVLLNAMRAGTAALHSDGSHFVLRLWMNGRMTYYMVRQPGTDLRYAIYARKYYDEALNCARFGRRVGCAFVTDDLKKYVELNFALLNMSLYMNTYPET